MKKKLGMSDAHKILKDISLGLFLTDVLNLIILRDGCKSTCFGNDTIESKGGLYRSG